MTDQDRQARIDALLDPSGRDVLLTWGSVGAQMVPWFGPALAAFISEFRQQPLRRMAEILVDLLDELERLGDRVDREHAIGPEYCQEVEAGLEEGARPRNTDKRAHYLAALARSALYDRPERLERRFLMRTLDQVDLGHLQLLAAIDANRYAVHLARPPNGAEGMAILAEVADLTPELAERCWEDLATWGVLESLSVLTADRVDTQPGPILPFGRRFIEFISDPLAESG